jgi:hypothetical protein
MATKQAPKKLMTGPEYRRSNGGKCPSCRTRSISAAGDSAMDFNACAQGMICYSCGYEWVACYRPAAYYTPGVGERSPKWLKSKCNVIRAILAGETRGVKRMASRRQQSRA